MLAKVRDFTEASSDVSPKIRPMDKDETKFIIGMILSETVELARTITSSNKAALKLVKELANTDFDNSRSIPHTDVEIIAEQADAFVDIIYYILNASVKINLDLDGVFDVVHSANMAKRFSNFVTDDGDTHRNVFVRSHVGKVLKPPNWQPPDVLSEITRQVNLPMRTAGGCKYVRLKDPSAEKNDDIDYTADDSSNDKENNNDVNDYDNANDNDGENDNNGENDDNGKYEDGANDDGDANDDLTDGLRQILSVTRSLTLINLVAMSAVLLSIILSCK